MNVLPFTPDQEAALRKQILGDLRKHMPAEAALVTCDLVFHAVQEALRTADRIIHSTGLPGMATASLGPVLSLLGGRTEQMLDALKKLAAERGIEGFEIPHEIPAPKG